MENNTPTSPALHPVIWIAGISVTLLSIVGIASFTGLLPVKSASPPPPPAAVVEAPAQPVPAATPTPPPPVPNVTITASPHVVPVPEPASPPAVHYKTRPRKTEQDRAPSPLAALPPPAGAGIPPDYVPPPAVAPAVAAPPPCANCGVIAEIRQITHEGKGSGLGAIAGGVLGGALGNNVGAGNGRTLATIAGAVGGGMLGNKIEKTERQTVGYRISVRMEDGTTQVIDASSMPPWRIGDPVRLVNGGIAAR